MKGMVTCINPEHSTNNWIHLHHLARHLTGSIHQQHLSNGRAHEHSSPGKSMWYIMLHFGSPPKYLVYKYCTKVYVKNTEPKLKPTGRSCVFHVPSFASTVVHLCVIHGDWNWPTANTAWLFDGAGLKPIMVTTLSIWQGRALFQQWSIREITLSM